MELNVKHPIYLIGGGGHCKVIVDCLQLQGGKISGYCDLSSIDWLENLSISRISEEEVKDLCSKKPQFAMSIVGKSADSLKERLQKIQVYKSYGAIFPTIIHPQAIISPSSKIQSGVHVLAGAVINSFSYVEEDAIVNTRAVIEHDVHIGAGSHVAPGSIILGGAKIGNCSYVGASSVIIQNTSVPESTFIKAGNVWQGR